VIEWYVPRIESCELVLLLLVPVGSLLEVVLVPQSAGEGASSRYSFRNVIPFRFLASQLDGQIVLLRSPFGLFLGGAFVG
jgi:hypothetical protein